MKYYILVGLAVTLMFHFTMAYSCEDTPGDSPKDAENLKTEMSRKDVVNLLKRDWRNFYKPNIPLGREDYKYLPNITTNSSIDVELGAYPNYVLNLKIREGWEIIKNGDTVIYGFKGWACFYYLTKISFNDFNRNKIYLNLDHNTSSVYGTIEMCEKTNSKNCKFESFALSNHLITSKDCNGRPCKVSKNIYLGSVGKHEKQSDNEKFSETIDDPVFKKLRAKHIKMKMDDIKKVVLKPTKIKHTILCYGEQYKFLIDTPKSWYNLRWGAQNLSIGEGKCILSRPLDLKYFHQKPEIDVTVVKKSKVKTLAHLISKIENNLKKKHVKMKIENAIPIELNDGSKIIVKHYRDYDNKDLYNTIGYLDDKDYVVLFKLRSEESNVSMFYYPVFVSVVKSYRKNLTGGSCSSPYCQSQFNTLTNAGKSYGRSVARVIDTIIYEQMESCADSNNSPTGYSGSYDLMIKITKHGKAIEVINHPPTQTAECFAKALKKLTYPKPPKDNYYYGVTLVGK